MSGLLKASATGAVVLPLASATSSQTVFAPGDGVTHTSPDRTPVEPANLSDDRAEALDRQCLELEATIAGLRSDLADAERQAKQREEAAFTKGRTEGAALAGIDEDKRIAALASGLDKLAVPIAECELLALQLSRAALGRLFADQNLHAELIEAAVAAQLARVGTDLVLGVSVSPLDFPSNEALDTLAGRFKGVEVLCDETLPAGGCIVRLRLGRIDLSLPGQWRNLCDYFDHLALEDAGA